MGHGKSIRIFLKDGSVTGIRHAEVYNWTGQAIACPKRRLPELKEWYDELPGTQNTGVYLLFGEIDGEQSVYVGESEDALERIGKHLTSKDFWNEVVIFTNKDQNLTKAHVQYLEAQLIRRVKSAGRYSLDNKNSPGGPSLPPAERAPMEEFIDHMRLVLGALAYRVLEPVGDSSPPVHAGSVGDSERSSAEETRQQPSFDAVFYFDPGDASAIGHLTDEGFLVHQGSTASKTTADSLRGTHVRMREQLVEDGRLVDKGEHYQFAESVLFGSSSYAASVVSGSPRSGPRAWQDEQGQLLRDREEEVKAALTGDKAVTE